MYPWNVVGWLSASNLEVLVLFLDRDLCRAGPPSACYTQKNASTRESKREQEATPGPTQSLSRQTLTIAGSVRMQILTQQICGGAWNSAFLPSSSVMLLLLVRRPHFKKPGARILSLPWSTWKSSKDVLPFRAKGPDRWPHRPFWPPRGCPPSGQARHISRDPGLWGPHSFKERGESLDSPAENRHSPCSRGVYVLVREDMQ